MARRAPDLDLVVTMDDASSEIYSAFLVEEGGVSTLRGLLEVLATKGLPSSLYTTVAVITSSLRRPANRSTRSNLPRSGGH
jgi:hypothetical protein